MKALNQLLPLYLSCTLLLMGNGLLFIIIPMSMRLDGQDTDAIGLVMSLYFVGMLLGSLYGRHLISRVGHIRIFLPVPLWLPCVRYYIAFGLYHWCGAYYEY